MLTVSLVGSQVEAVAFAPGHFPRLIELDRTAALKDAASGPKDMTAVVRTDGAQHLVGALAQRAIDRRLDGVAWRWACGKEILTPTGRTESTSLLSALVAKARLFRRALVASKRETALEPSALIVLTPDSPGDATIREIEASCLLAGVREVSVRSISVLIGRLASIGTLRPRSLVINLLAERPSWTIYDTETARIKTITGGAIPLPPDLVATGSSIAWQTKLHRQWQGYEQAQPTPVLVNLTDDRPAGAMVSDQQIEDAMSRAWRAVIAGLEQALLDPAEIGHITVLGGPHNRMRRTAPPSLAPDVRWIDGHAEALSALARMEEESRGKDYGAPFRLVLCASSEARAVREQYPDIEVLPAGCRLPHRFHRRLSEPNKLFSVLSLRAVAADGSENELAIIQNPRSVQNQSGYGVSGILHAACNGTALIEYAYATEADRNVVLFAYDQAANFQRTVLNAETLDSLRSG